MVYLLLVPVLVMMLLEVRHILRLRKHDKLLFALCRIRGDLLCVIAEQRLAGTLTQADYIYARVMINALNTTVGLYAEHRWRMFNFHAFIERVRTYRRSAKGLLAVPRTENPALVSIDQRIHRAILDGFLEYTPMLKSQLIAEFMLFVMGVLARAGYTAVESRMRAVREVLQVAHAQATMLGQPERFRYA